MKISNEFKEELIEIIEEGAVLYHDLIADHWALAACTEETPCKFCKMAYKLKERMK